MKETEIIIDMLKILKKSKMKEKTIKIKEIMKED